MEQQRCYFLRIFFFFFSLSKNNKSLSGWTQCYFFSNENRVKFRLKDCHPSNPVLSLWKQVTPQTCYPTVKSLQEFWSLYHHCLRKLHSPWRRSCLGLGLLHFWLKVLSCLTHANVPVFSWAMACQQESIRLNLSLWLLPQGRRRNIISPSVWEYVRLSAIVVVIRRGWWKAAAEWIKFQSGPWAVGSLQPNLTHSGRVMGKSQGSVL